MRRQGTLSHSASGGNDEYAPRALYGDGTWEESLKNTLAAPSVKVLSGGRIAGKQFLIAAIVGAPALLAEPRESMREGNIVDAIQKGSVAFRKMFETKIQYLISGEIKGEAEAVALICSLISEQMSDSEQALEAAVIDVESATEVIGLSVPLRLVNGAITEIYFSPEQEVCLCDRVKISLP